jgi:hypothetical protein
MRILVGLCALAVLAVAAPAAAEVYGTAPVSGSGPGGQTVLTSVTVARHDGFDRVVFTSRDGIGDYSVRYVPRVTGNASGRPVPLGGSAFLEVIFQGTPWQTSPAPKVAMAPGFPALKGVRDAEEFEAVAEYGIGQAARSGFRAFTLTGPARLVIDLAAPPGPTSSRTGNQVGDPTSGQAGGPTNSQTDSPASGQTGNPTNGQAGNPTNGQAGNPTSSRAGNPAAGQAGNPAGGQAGSPAGGQADRQASGPAGARASGAGTAPDGQATGSGGGGLPDAGFPVLPIGLLALALALAGTAAALYHRRLGGAG